MSTPPLECSLSAAPLPDPPPSGTRAATLREVGADLSDADAGLFAHAAALEQWHARHVRCPLCGAATVVALAGHVRRCVNDGSEHYPRTDPAVIMLVTDGDDRCLLGRQPSWPAGRMSTLAGYVEAGETLEHAVVREVFEEVGRQGRRRALRREPALAVPVELDARVHRAGHDDGPARSTTTRSPKRAGSVATSCGPRSPAARCGCR